MDKETIKTLFDFTGRITIVHFITYFLIGAIFYFSGLNAVVYNEANPDPIVSAFLRSTSSIWVLSGQLFQILRGLIFGLVLFPFRRIFLERKWGWIYLWGIFLGLAIFAPSGPSPGSIEGLVYTNLPAMFHLIALPEILLQTLIFSWLAVKWEHYKDKKLTIPLVVVFIIILIISIMGILIG